MKNGVWNWILSVMQNSFATSKQFCYNYIFTECFFKSFGMKKFIETKLYPCKSIPTLECMYMHTCVLVEQICVLWNPSSKYCPMA